MIVTRDERVQHYLYLLTIWIICICTRTGRGLTRKWVGFNLKVGRVVLKWAGALFIYTSEQTPRLPKLYWLISKYYKPK